MYVIREQITINFYLVDFLLEYVSFIYTWIRKVRMDKTFEIGTCHLFSTKYTNLDSTSSINWGRE